MIVTCSRFVCVLYPTKPEDKSDIEKYRYLVSSSKGKREAKKIFKKIGEISSTTVCDLAKKILNVGNVYVT